jgi:hypothetical protein
MLTDDVRRRLEALNRQSFPAGTGHPPRRARAPRSLGEVAGGTLQSNALGEHFRICRPLAELLPAVPSAAAPPATAPVDPAQHPDLARLAAAFPRQTLFLDLETCGFAGSAVFLVGLVRHDGQSLVLDQLLARDYREEPAMLFSFWQLAAVCDVLATFNGKSFDWPMVLERSARHRLDPRRAALAHCDLLHHARRRWKSRLPDCRLQTLEHYICRRRRTADLGGAEIPLAYHQFVRDGDARPLLSILEHNALDLLTLVELAIRLLGR